MAVSADDLWLCSSLTGVMVWDGKSVSPPRRRTSRGVRAPRSTGIGADACGSVSAAVATAERRSTRTGGSARFSTPDGLTPGPVVAITEDRSGSIWLATASGLNRYKDGRITAITAPQAPLTEVLPTLVEDDEGFLWVGTRSGSGMLRIHPREADKLMANPAAPLEYAVYDSSDGLSQSRAELARGRHRRPRRRRPAVVRDRAGHRDLRSPNAPAHLTRQSRLSSRVSSPTAGACLPARELALPNRTSTLRLEYGAISLSAASKLRFRYMLEGLHDDWVMAGPAREAVFTDLPSGNYRFRLAGTHDGPWVEAPASIISVAPPFYRDRLVPGQRRWRPGSAS